jgi:hypothetical protein
MHNTKSIIMKHNYLLSLFFIGLIITKYSFAQSDSLDMDFDINIKLMNSTFLIAGEGNNACGTGFIMLKKNLIYKTKYTESDVVFITAAHVLDSIKGNRAIIYYRKNNNNYYKTIPCPILIRNNKVNFYVKHPTMDIAAMHVTLLPGFNYNEILNESWLADDYTLVEYKIRTGETLNCLGYPYCINDTLGNFPILRSGKIASFPLLP